MGDSGGHQYRNNPTERRESAWRWIPAEIRTTPNTCWKSWTVWETNWPGVDHPTPMRTIMGLRIFKAEHRKPNFRVPPLKAPWLNNRCWNRFFYSGLSRSKRLTHKFLFGETGNDRRQIGAGDWEYRETLFRLSISPAIPPVRSGWSTMICFFPATPWCSATTSGNLSFLSIRMWRLLSGL